jgi:hypothetical protein
MLVETLGPDTIWNPLKEGGAKRLPFPFTENVTSNTSPAATCVLFTDAVNLMSSASSRLVHNISKSDNM